jgi:hypothetical protein
VENAVSGPDLQAINAGKREVRETMDAKINNVIYMKLYSGPKMMDDEYLKSNIARSIDRDSTVLTALLLFLLREIPCPGSFPLDTTSLHTLDLYHCNTYASATSPSCITHTLGS